jgi:hypothetical protein
MYLVSPKVNPVILAQQWTASGKATQQLGEMQPLVRRGMELVLYEESILTRLHQRQQTFQFNGLIEKHVMIDQEGRGTGGILWPAAELLSHFLNQDSDFDLSSYLSFDEESNQKKWNWKEKRVLEFGSGLGLTSIILSSLGAKVLATDGEETVVNQLSRNFDLNLNSNDRENCKSCVYEWGNDFQQIFNCLDQSPSWTSPHLFDLIIAADVIYGEDPKIWSLLEQSIQQAVELSHAAHRMPTVLQPQPIILIAQTERYPEKESFFFRRLGKRFQFREAIDLTGTAMSAATTVNGESIISKCTLYVFTESAASQQEKVVPLV